MKRPLIDSPDTLGQRDPAAPSNENRTVSLSTVVHLSNDTAKPLYLQLADQLRSLILEGRLPSGTVLSAERQLAETLGVSRATVQRAYDLLRQDSLVSARGRHGFHVEHQQPRLHPGLDRLKGFTEEMREIGKTPSSRILERKVVTDRSIASIFGLPSSSRLLRLVRVRYGDDVPLSREIAWYNLTAASGLAEVDLSGSVYAYLATQGLPLVSCDQAIEAATPSADECKIFGLSEPIPCLLIKRSSYTNNKIMMEYVEGLFRGDLYSYRLKLNA
jgi:GntR family transcriptional regulator